MISSASQPAPSDHPGSTGESSTSNAVDYNPARVQALQAKAEGEWQLQIIVENYYSLCY